MTLNAYVLCLIFLRLSYAPRPLSGIYLVGANQREPVEIGDD